MNNGNYESKEIKRKKMQEHIFNVSLSLIQKIGYENVTIRMICKEAEISTGMFYQHFSSKEDILSFYYDKAAEDSELIIKEQLSDLPVKEQLIKFYVWICQFTSELGVDFCRNFFSSKNRYMNTDLFHNKFIDITNRCLEDAIANDFKLSPGRTPYMVSKDLCVIIKGVIFDWSAHKGNYNMAEFAERLMLNCIDGLL